MARTKAEQETIIRWDEEVQTLDVYTASPLVARRLIAPRLSAPADRWRLAGGRRRRMPSNFARWYAAPRKRVDIVRKIRRQLAPLDRTVADPTPPLPRRRSLALKGT